MYSDAVLRLMVIGVVAIFALAIGLQLYGAFDKAKHARTFDERMERSLEAMDQSWFTAEPWQAGEARADADLAAGRSRAYSREDTFLAALDELPAADER